MIMGRIKTQLVKRTTNELLEQYGDKFSEDYEKNKRVVAQLVIGVGKKIRNIIAGYVTRLVKKQHASDAMEFLKALPGFIIDEGMSDTIE